MRTTKIEWTDKTWNPITGCTKKSAGCAHCYAEVMARRLKAMGLENLSGIDWIIAGGESSPKARPMRLEWVVNIKQQVERHGAAFFFKQWGTWGSDGIKRNKHANGKLLLGEVIQEMPERIAV